MSLKNRFRHIRIFILSYKYQLSIVFLTLLLATLLIPNIRRCNKPKTAPSANVLETIDCQRELYATAPIAPQRKLNDDNDLQLLHAQANGLKQTYADSPAFEQDSAGLVERGTLVRIKNNPLYHLKTLTHSYPYVTPEMAQLLNDIGLVFREKLRRHNHDYFRPMITSALRTGETQGTLSARNRNAAKTSTHLYGTTVDITYKDFFNTRTHTVEQNYYAALALRETMLDMREQCRLLVMRERRQACYHFTVVNCDPNKVPKKAAHHRPLMMY